MSEGLQWLQVRNGQLDKEALELRTENSMLSQNANMSRLSEANVQEVSTHIV